LGAMTNLLVKDDAASPVEYTFKPVTDKDGSPYWRTSISGVPLEGQMRYRLTEEQLKDGNWKRTAKLEVPVMETLGASGTSAGLRCATKSGVRRNPYHHPFLQSEEHGGG